MSEKTVTACLLIIGNEILSGRTQDKNIAQIATWLDAQGIRLREVRVVPDVEDEIVDARSFEIDRAFQLRRFDNYARRS